MTRTERPAAAAPVRRAEAAVAPVALVAPVQRVETAARVAAKVARVAVAEVARAESPVLRALLVAEQLVVAARQAAAAQLALQATRTPAAQPGTLRSTACLLHSMVA